MSRACRLPSTAHFGRARALHRFGTDGNWYSVSHDSDPSAGGWERDAGTPAVTLVILESLRADLRLTWPNAVEAVQQLIQHPENPATFYPSCADAHATRFPGKSLRG